MLPLTRQAALEGKVDFYPLIRRTDGAETLILSLKERYSKVRTTANWN
ncbi:hypothetical protein AVDCRST_MAG81-864 [uncultured Synechococcales cyanobacterium]|uniref:Uncharacterized protein n=1 Tax=uncultured Synechococcales cyanobacterium TaxID=1936017 RepID=A0A6J4UWF6_9CYAN|nr:hypothetical protein AVDCRST_MAG81-864 [uncultured Synechococcales cyanobacterium]